MLHPVLEGFVLAQQLLNEDVNVINNCVQISNKHPDVIVSGKILINNEQLFLYINKDYYGYFREILKEYHQIKLEGTPNSRKHRVQLVIYDTPEKLVACLSDIEFIIEKARQMKIDFDKKFYGR